MKEQELYDYIERELGGRDLDELPDGILVPQDVSTDEFLRVLENVEKANKKPN